MRRELRASRSHANSAVRLRSNRVLLQYMFQGTETSIPKGSDFSGWDTSSVTDMSVSDNGITYTPHPPYPQLV